MAPTLYSPLNRSKGKYLHGTLDPILRLDLGPSSVSTEINVEFVRSYFCSNKGPSSWIQLSPYGPYIHDIPSWEHVNRSLQSNKKQSWMCKTQPWCWFWLSTITTILPGSLFSQLIRYHIRCFLPRGRRCRPESGVPSECTHQEKSNQSVGSLLKTS